jgi:hypothetical protein
MLQVYFIGHSAGAQLGALAILQNALRNNNKENGTQFLSSFSFGRSQPFSYSFPLTYALNLPQI